MRHVPAHLEIYSCEQISCSFFSPRLAVYADIPDLTVGYIPLISYDQSKPALCYASLEEWRELNDDPNLPLTPHYIIEKWVSEKLQEDYIVDWRMPKNCSQCGNNLIVSKVYQHPSEYIAEGGIIHFLRGVSINESYGEDWDETVVLKNVKKSATENNITQNNKITERKEQKADKKEKVGTTQLLKWVLLIIFIGMFVGRMILFLDNH